MMVKINSFWFAAAVALISSCAAPQQSERSNEIKFKKHVLSTEYIAEGAAVADVNKDGLPDVLAGTFWWQAPEWIKHELTTAEIHASINGYGNSFFGFAYDINGDGWEDYIKVGFPGAEAFWYENPQNKEGHWTKRLLYPSVGNESPMFVDVDGDGRPDLLCNDSKNKKVIWISPPSNKGDTAWTAHIISDDPDRATHMFTHGLGLGDINGDGRKDVIIKSGWWEAPEDRTQPNWKFHPANLGVDCSQMFVLDLDGDGDNDVISASAHQYGIWWHEQISRGDSIAFTQHEIFTEFSQSHGLTLADMNGDGHPDIVTGKRYWAHNGHDPGERDPAVLYWFEYKPGSQPQWTPHLIDSRSGVGVDVVARDINNDGLIDIVVANKHGVFVFERLK